MKIRQHTELEVYKKAFDAAMLLFVSMIRKPESWTIG
jgi:hypothetical protein